MSIATKRQLVDLSSNPAFFALLTDSYARLVGKSLVPPGKDADWLYRYAPFVVLAHGTEHDPKFIYANKAAQACFEYSWDEFLALPSRLSAEAPDQADVAVRAADDERLPARRARDIPRFVRRAPGDGFRRRDEHELG